MRLRKKDKREITAVLLCGLVAFLAMYGLMSVIGTVGFMSFGLIVFGVMVFFTIVLPLIDRLIIFFGMKIIERQNNKEKS